LLQNNHRTDLVAEVALGGLGVGVQHEGVGDPQPGGHLLVHPGGPACTHKGGQLGLEWPNMRHIGLKKIVETNKTKQSCAKIFL